MTTIALQSFCTRHGVVEAARLLAPFVGSTVTWGDFTGTLAVCSPETEVPYGEPGERRLYITLTRPSGDFCGGCVRLGGSDDQTYYGSDVLEVCA